MVDIGDQSSSFNPLLSRILARSNQFLDSRPQPTRSCLPAHIHVELPEPPALLPALVAAGARPEIAQAMQAAYHQRACKFREQALAAISRACSNLAQIPSMRSHASDESTIAAFKQVYLKKLNTWISEGVALLQEKGPAVLRCQDDHGSLTEKIPKTFNHQYVPLLEHFFEENPFPTHADKVFLARKSSMTYRQIHVWFQNRRNRTKKPLHKKPMSDGPPIPIDTLVRRTEKFATLPAAKSDISPSNRSTPAAPSTKTDNVLNGVAPPHAFPTIYPPRREYDPFPIDTIFVTPGWSRRPIVESKKMSHITMDIEELTEKFSRLNVWDDLFSRSRRKVGEVQCDGSAATSAITIKPPPAPHPACVRTTIDVPTPPRITFQAVRAVTSRPHVFRSPSPDLPMTTLVPALSHQRKIAPLPRRIPPLSPNWGSSGSPTNPPSLTSSSRSSSFNSEVSVQDHTFAVNWSSHPPSTVTTPETSPSPPLSHLT